MAEEIRLWRIEEGKALFELPAAKLDLEERLEDWLARDISVLEGNLLVIGRQVETDFGGYIDLLCLDKVGDLVVVELKRHRTPRDVTAQVLDYGAWVQNLSNDRIAAIAGAHIGTEGLDEAFRRRFGTDLPETLNENHRMLVVGAEIDPGSERIIKYLSETYGVNINAATFQYFKDGAGAEFLARVFLLQPLQVELQSRAKGSSKRQPNLTFEELEAAAEEAGVGDLYRRAVTGIERHLQKHTTRSSIGFAGLFDGSRKTVVSLIPGKSSAADGLRFQVYFRRIQTLLGLSPDGALAILPSRREPWIYFEGAGADYEGFVGFFANAAEIDRFVAAFARVAG